MYLLLEDNTVVEYTGKSANYGKVKAVIATPNSRNALIEDVKEILSWIPSHSLRGLNSKQEIQDIAESLARTSSKL